MLIFLFLDNFLFLEIIREFSFFLFLIYKNFSYKRNFKNYDILKKICYKLAFEGKFSF